MRPKENFLSFGRSFAGTALYGGRIEEVRLQDTPFAKVPEPQVPGPLYAAVRSQLCESMPIARWFLGHPCLIGSDGGDIILGEVDLPRAGGHTSFRIKADN